MGRLDSTKNAAFILFMVHSKVEWPELNAQIAVAKKHVLLRIELPCSLRWKGRQSSVMSRIDATDGLPYVSS